MSPICVTLNMHSTDLLNPVESGLEGDVGQKGSWAAATAGLKATGHRQGKVEGGTTGRRPQLTL